MAPLYYSFYAMLVELIDFETRLYEIDETTLRSSKYDSESKFDKTNCFGYFKSYKLNCITTVTNIIVVL